MSYALLINDERTVLVRMWENGTVEVATRPEQGAIWGPPIVVKPENQA